MDDQIRNTAFTWLKHLTFIHCDVLPREILKKEFDFQGQNIIPIGASGIWKPKIIELPLFITTSPESPYDDAITTDEFLKYNYRGTDPYRYHNVGLREIMKQGKPLIYFLGVSKGNYLAAWPVYIVNDNIPDLSFTVVVDDMRYLKKTGELEVAEDNGNYSRRKYVTSQTLIRLHQCSLCCLRHRELLDAAHIIGDREETGEPIIQNGLSLCKIHHAAFDQNIIGINPDYQIKVRKDILEEIDGPMLKYGNQFLENEKLLLPGNRSNWPDRKRLGKRFEGFLRAT